MFKKIKSFLFENKTVRQTVAKNTFWAAFSNFGGKALKAIIIIYGARVLGTAEYGVFSYALTLAGFFTLFFDPGVNSMVMREVPKATNEDGRLRILSTTLAVKLALIAGAVLIVLFVAPLFSTLPGATALLPIVALIIALDTTREFLSSFIRANEKMEWETGIFLLTNLGIVIAGFLFLSYSRTALSFGWAYVAGTAFGAITAITVLRKRLAHIFSYFSARLIKPILTSAWPFAITGALGILLTNTDILIVSWMRSASEVGIYSAVIRIIQVLYIIPSIFQLSTFPTLSRFVNTSSVKFRSALERIVGLLFLASVPMAIGGAILGTQIMDLVFGTAYVSGGLALKILMITLIVDYPTVIISTAIFAYDRQKSLIVASLIGGIMNVALDLILIPPFGIAGSAFGTLLTQIVTNWYLWHVMKRINYFEVAPQLKKIITAGVVMGAMAVFLFFLSVNVVITIAVCAAFYFLILYRLHEPLLIELKSILRGAIPKTSTS
ncbi:MAG: flippase [Minisyncoccia bacterium]|jgi:PST family polysaccharide transporter